jgi:hypothetical protein
MIRGGDGINDDGSTRLSVRSLAIVVFFLIPLALSVLAFARRSQKIFRAPVPIQRPFNSTHPGPPRVAVCFWGVNRALPHTVASIDKNIFGALEEHFVEYDVFFHTYSLLNVTSAWAEENGVAVPGAADELRRFQARKHLARYEVTNQDDFDLMSDWKSYKVPQWGHRWTQDVILNVLRSTFSLHRVTALWQLEVAERPRCYSQVLYVRPDLHYMTTLNVPQLLSAGDYDFLTPNWGQYRGINDRLGAGGLKAARAFGSRSLLAHAYGQRRPFHPESFARWSLDREGVNLGFFCLCGVRERSDGRVLKDDCTAAKNHLGLPSAPCEEFDGQAVTRVDYPNAKEAAAENPSRNRRRRRGVAGRSRAAMGTSIAAHEPRRGRRSEIRFKG